MNQTAPDPRWDGLEEAIREAANALPELGEDPAGVLPLLDNGYLVLAVTFCAGSIGRSDGRDAALRIAELLAPRVDLMVDAPDYFSGTLSAQQVTDSCEELSRRLASVIDANRTDRGMPPEFRADVERWWDEVASDEGNVDGLVARAQDRRDAPETGDAERFWFEEILIGWLYRPDQWRWQPALTLLARNEVRRAAIEMRSAATFAHGDKAPFADTFRRYADDLDGSAAGGAA